MTRLSMLLVAAAAVFTLSPAEAQYYYDRHGWEPPCEPGKVRVIVRGNSQCRYPGEARGGRDYGYRDYGYRDRGYYGGGLPPCEPGKRRVIIRGNPQCR